jgi:hypothetical protein
MRLLGQALLAALAAAFVLAATAGAAQSPQALLSALLKAKVTSADLPHGYSAPVVSAYKLSAAVKKRGAIGGAQIFADGGNEAVIYIVFSTPAQAEADWKNASFHGAKTSPAPGSIPKPNIEVNTSTGATVNGKNVTFGLTEVATLAGNVIVQSITATTKSTNHGDVTGAVLLAQFALKQLNAAR